MTEAVIVSTARSPIGRAGKGSLVDMRPDDLAAQMVRAALDKVPALDPREIDDLIMGCGQPGGEAGFNVGRAVSVELGYDFLPGTTVNRYCSSSLQTTRMAFHAIKAGEGSAFVSAGVETVLPCEPLQIPAHPAWDSFYLPAALQGRATWLGPRWQAHWRRLPLRQGERTLP